MSMQKEIAKMFRRWDPIKYRRRWRRRRFSRRKYRPIVLQHNNLGALVIDTGKRGSRRFWIRIGRVRPKYGTDSTEVTKGLYPMDVLSLPGLAMQIARYLAKQTIVKALEPDDVHFRKELRQDLMQFVQHFQNAKWNGTFPKYLTWLTRRQCRCFFDAQEKGLQIVIPEVVETEVQIDPKKRDRFSRIDKALGI